MSETTRTNCPLSTTSITQLAGSSRCRTFVTTFWLTRLSSATSTRRLGGTPATASPLGAGCCCDGVAMGAAGTSLGAGITCLRCDLGNGARGDAGARLAGAELK